MVASEVTDKVRNALSSTNGPPESASVSATVTREGSTRSQIAVPSSAPLSGTSADSLQQTPRLRCEQAVGILRTPEAHFLWPLKRRASRIYLGESLLVFLPVQLVGIDPPIVVSVV